MLEKIEAKLRGAESEKQQEIARIRHQNRKRSRRAKLKLLAHKRHRGEKKALRAAVSLDHAD